MSYATVMVYVEVDGRPEGRVAFATGLSDKFKATLIGLSALAIQPLFLEIGEQPLGTRERSALTRSEARNSRLAR
jgi:hypothetical protein